jgi:hypothetical protein
MPLVDAPSKEYREERVDRLVLLLSARPREGWEEIFAAAREREAARLLDLRLRGHEELEDDDE